MRSLLGTVIWVVCYSLSSLQVCPAICFWPEEFLLTDQLLSLWESPCVLYVVSPLLLLIFVVCVWSLLIWLIVSWGVSPWVYPVWDSLGFLDLCDYFFPHLREVFSYYLLECFLMAFLFLFFFWGSYDSNAGAFHIVPEVPEVVLFSFFLSASFISTILSSTSLTLSSASIILLLVPSRVFLI